ncbi:MAG: transketolase [Armatimonadetes bacterium]|nr:transketolase [Armatimonadota bacterium]
MSDAIFNVKLDNLAVNTIKFLAVDGIEKANSGHPGLPMGAADYSFVLWTKFLRYNPKDPKWPNRDRFILSAGHGSMLLYSLLHLAGFDMPHEELMKFRQWGSATPGHPEFELERGIETTTGPLGQGLGNAVGMAMAQKRMAAIFNKPGCDVLNHWIYVICGDGDMMEGISHEACSLAGHLGLGNITLIYDDNHICIEGDTCLSYSDEVQSRFESYGWDVQKIDGHDRIAAKNAIAAAKAETSKPSIIIARTHIANGAPNKHDTASAHGEPLGEAEVKATKELAGWPVDKPFFVPDEVRELFSTCANDKLGEYEAWQAMFKKYCEEFPELAKLWNQMMSKEVPADLDDKLIAALDCVKPTATRASSGMAIQEISKLIPAFWGGSADLSPSNKTDVKGGGSFSRENPLGKNIHFGVREHGMGALLNGMAVYGGVIPYGGTFLVFCDYMRPAIRMASIMEQQVIYVFTHDSIFVGEDGPTHEPIEQIASLRMIPHCRVMRPADTAETAVAWAAALDYKKGPTVLALTRQNLAPVNDDPSKATQLRRGAYIVRDTVQIDVMFIATGSEVGLALGAAEILAAKGIKARVVSMPCVELFEEQDKAYRDSVIPPSVKKRVVVEAGISFGWCKYTGDEGIMIGMDRFGASAPYNVLAEKFGFTAESVAAKTEEYLK